MTAHEPHDTPINTPMTRLRRITLLRAAHRWTFAFTAEDEPRVVKRAAELARDPQAPFDWLDALTLCELIARLPAPASPPATGRPNTIV